MVKVTVTRIAPDKLRDKRYATTKIGQMASNQRMARKGNMVRVKFQLNKFSDWKSSVCGGTIRTSGRNIFRFRSDIRAGEGNGDPNCSNIT